MEYQNIKAGRFISRPNRFIAMVDMGGETVRCHVKNTGRCRELLVPGAVVYLEDHLDAPGRKTRYDLVAVEKGARLINMDSQAPNAAVGEYLAAGDLFPPGSVLRREFNWGASRFDFHIQMPNAEALLEVKGVTLEERNVCLFPDAPTQRGTRHLRELIKAAREGIEAYVFFLIQMEGAAYFTPNAATDAAFAQALWDAAEAGVHILAYDCCVTPKSMAVHARVPVRL